MSELIHWEDAQNMKQNFRCVGMLPLVIAEDVYFATQLSMMKEHEIQQIGGNNLVTAGAINGSMLLFCQPEFPDLWDDDNGVPEPVRMEWMTDDRAVALDDVLFSAKHSLPGYEKCEAAYVEWVAKEMSISEMTKTINTRITL